MDHQHNFSDWQPPTSPKPGILTGDSVRLEPLNADRHAATLFAATRPISGGPDVWTYLPDEPLDSLEVFAARLRSRENSLDPLHYAIIDRATEKPVGSVAYLRVTPVHGVIEIGHVLFTPQLQRTRAATEVIFLLLRHAFDDLGYRRVEWKCNALNEPSRRAALRFGFQYEGLFRQHMIVKGRNRDTTWFSLLDSEWPLIRTAFIKWLDSTNFDEAGQQRQSLTAIRASLAEKNSID